MVTLGEKEIFHHLNDPQVQEPKAHVVAQISKGSGYSEDPQRPHRAPTLQIHGAPSQLPLQTFLEERSDPKFLTYTRPWLR